MSLILDESHGLEAKTGSRCSCHRGGVWITGMVSGKEQDVWISDSDFAELIKYYLTNMALPDSGKDVRTELVEWIKELRVGRDPQGWMRLMKGTR